MGYRRKDLPSARDVLTQQNAGGRLGVERGG